MSGNILVDKMTRLAAEARERQQREILEQLTLPFWPEDKRGVPNGLLRCALFAALMKRRSAASPRFFKREKMASLGGTEIIYTGIQLDQDHLSVWECLVHIARMQQLGDKCFCSIYQILKMLDKEDTGNYRAWLLRKMSELQATSVEVVQGGYAYSGSLIMELFRDDLTSNVIVILSPKIIALYQADQYTQVHWDIRRALSAYPLAQWLHGFYSTHREPLPLRAETIHALCGSTSKSVRNFKGTSLKSALEQMKTTYKRFRLHFDYAIAGELVHVTFDASRKLPTPGTESTPGRNRINAAPEQNQRTTGTESKRYRNRINGNTGTESTGVPEQNQQSMSF